MRQHGDVVQGVAARGDERDRHAVAQADAAQREARRSVSQLLGDLAGLDQQPGLDEARLQRPPPRADHQLLVIF